MKTVYLVPGFLSTNLIITAKDELLWWAPNLAAALSLGALRLAPDGVSPGLPDGEEMHTSNGPQDMWNLVESQLKSQIPQDQYELEIWKWDWRKEIMAAGVALADDIRAFSTFSEPATIVGHSAGGLVAVCAYCDLKNTGQEQLVRRIVTICTPFQGSYTPILWLTGTLGSVQQLLSLLPLAASIQPSYFLYWTIGFLNGLALSWPAFYELMPALGGSDAANDPNRALLYDAANYPVEIRPSQAWLDYAKNTFQPFLADPCTFPPAYVLTTVVSTSLYTFDSLTSGNLPLNLKALGSSPNGDTLVSATSQTRQPGEVVRCYGAHGGLPLGIAVSGDLAKLILDPRGPISPPPPPQVISSPLPMSATDPPESAYVSPLVCIGGG